MPLVDSGPALFAGSAKEFVDMAPASRLTAHLVREFDKRWGTASESETRAWKHSLTALAKVVTQSSLDGSGVAVEVRLPYTDRRIDVSLLGKDSTGHPGVVLVELKQWDIATPSDYPELVVVGGREHLHPSAQAGSYAAYLRESHSAFTESSFNLRPCAYLHEMSRAYGELLRGKEYEGAVRDAPLFVKGDERELSTLFIQSLSGGDGMSLLPTLLSGRYSPSRKLIEGIAESLSRSPVWTLLDEQRIAFDYVRGLIRNAAPENKRAVVLVVGGPGTGKSVIAAHLVVALSREDGLRVCHATGSKAFTTNLRAIAPRGGSAVFRYFNSFRHKAAHDDLDVLVCDEAHRIRKTSNDRFTPRRLRSEMSQARELIRAARVSVFLLDEHQNVRGDEIGSVSAIEEGALGEGATVHRVNLTAQFRCNGCPEYVDWVDVLLSDNPSPAGRWLAAGEYDFSVFDSAPSLESAVRERVSASGAITGRIVAGFCWPWSDPREDGSLMEDVRIGRWKRPWNEKSREQTRSGGPSPKPDKHPYYLWATEPQRIGEIGCIYSIQGFEFDYCGVIMGPDLVWREGTGWVADRQSSQDPAIVRKGLEQERVKQLLRHTYRVLLTRGTRATYVYSTDAETQVMLGSLVSSEKTLKATGRRVRVD